MKFCTTKSLSHKIYAISSSVIIGEWFSTINLAIPKIFPSSVDTKAIFIFIGTKYFILFLAKDWIIFGFERILADKFLFFTNIVFLNSSTFPYKAFLCGIQNNSGKMKSKGFPINSSLVKPNKRHKDNDKLHMVPKLVGEPLITINLYSSLLAIAL